MFFIRTLWHNLISKYHHWQYERECLKYFGAKPETIYLSKEAYDSLVKRLNEPPDQESISRLKEIMQRKPPWEE